MIGPEPWLDAAAQALRTHLPGTLDEISDALGLVGGDRLPKPQDLGPEYPIAGGEVDYYVGVVRTPLRYPIIEIAVPDDSLTNFSLARLTGDYELNMIVMASLRSADLTTGKLYRTQLAYRRGLLDVLLDPEKYLSAGAITSVRTAYRQNPQDREDAEMIFGAIAVGLTIETTDQRDL